MYKNPILPGFCPDPSICYAEGTYYIVTSTFEFFPGVTIWESDDLANWKYCSAVLTRTDQLDLDRSRNSQGLYAASIRYNRGRFYMVTTNKYTHENFICHTDDIHGEWSETSFIYRTGIDPSLLFLEDGRCFYCSNETINGLNRGIIGAFIDPDTGELQEEMRVLSKGCGGHSTEAPHIYFVDGYYYLIIAEGGTGQGHHVCALRSRDIHGPYEANPGNPILSHVDRKGHPIQCTGHADLLKRPDGSWIAVFLAVRKPKIRNYHLGRESFLAPVTWKDGWPVIGNDGLVELEMDIPGLISENSDDYSVDFANDYKRYPYLKVRVPKDECYIQDRKERTLTLVGEDEISRNLGHPTLLAFRQRGFYDSMKVSLALGSQDEKTDAGITAFLNSDYHYRISAHRNGDIRTFQLIRHIHDFEAITEVLIEKEAASCIDELEIRATPEEYYFYVSRRLLGKAVTAGIAPNNTMNGAFTGVLFALFSEHGRATFQGGIEFRSRENTPIFIDIDGTLLNSRKELTERTREALVYAKSRGYVIVLCSGRCYDGLKGVLEQLPFSPWTATLNGAYIRDDMGRVVHQDTIGTEVLASLQEIGKRTGCHSLYFFGEHWGADNNRAIYDSEFLVTHQDGINEPLEEVMRTNRINKYLSTGTHEECLEFMHLAKEEFPAYEIELSSPTYVEVNTPTTTKGKAVKIVSRLLGVSTERAICFGDYYNDMTMFQIAGESVAMENAVAEIRKAAKYTTESNDNDGLAIWIEENL
ncbi:MAG: Cof-type HAD-IIB family hydrolase [Spirochaetales bacterium]|nr:Cof-type HAD-IIB family hydrolase [Spirochaetales bacterium]